MSVNIRQPIQHQIAREILHNGQNKNEVDSKTDVKEEKNH